ncbi:hypothetical protein [Vibrio sp. S12_S33]|uniref:hypothetical protein n=1 Tax=Vibrio sp. S12_S33 TaxID=2720223 RepID=UPI00177D891C|nr:hypothetical protein [Vibrio sp. S12_S33]MBD1566193.1 hypothetical protein [Vibrio sp. S12_S33]
MNISNLSGISIPNSSPNKTIVTQDIKARLAAIDNAQAKLNQTDTAILESDMQPASAETLAMIAAQQKQVVMAMVNGNPDLAIAIALSQSIEAYGKQLEAINSWTQGGTAVLEPMLDMIYDSIIEGGVDGTEYEDLMQLLVTDVLMHADQWGIDLTVLLGSDYEVHVAQITEHFGSGLHAPYTEYDKHPPTEITSWFLDTFVKNLVPLVGKNIPADSLSAKILLFFDEDSNQAGLDKCAANYWTDPNGFINGASKDNPAAKDCNRLSPMLKIFLISSCALDGAITTEEWDEILLGGTAEVEVLLGVGDGELGQYLVDNVDDWDPSSGNTPKDKVEKDRYPDFTKGSGIYPNDLINMLVNFPARELTDEDIEEINRIGDQVKMLQQTLKYWLSICRDEQMAIARNI